MLYRVEQSCLCQFLLYIGGAHLRPVELCQNTSDNVLT